MEALISILLLAWRDGFGALTRRYGILVAIAVGLMLPFSAIVAIVLALFQFT